MKCLIFVLRRWRFFASHHALRPGLRDGDVLGGRVCVSVVYASAAHLSWPPSNLGPAQPGSPFRAADLKLQPGMLTLLSLTFKNCIPAAPAQAESPFRDGDESLEAERAMKMAAILGFNVVRALRRAALLCAGGGAGRAGPGEGRRGWVAGCVGSCCGRPAYPVPCLLQHWPHPATATCQFVALPAAVLTPPRCAALRRAAATAARCCRAPRCWRTLTRKAC